MVAVRLERLGARDSHAPERAKDVGRPAVSGAIPEVGVVAVKIAAHQEQLDHDAVDQECALVGESLRDDLLKATLPDHVVQISEALAGQQEIDISGRAGDHAAPRPSHQRSM